MSRMESLDMEQPQRPARRSQPGSSGLAPLLHLRLNTLLNALVLGLMIAAANIEPWFAYKGTQFSLVGLNMEDLGGWQGFGDFAVRCTKDNLDRRRDYRDDCEGLDSYQFAGILALIFLYFGMTIQTFNLISAANLGWGCRLGQFELDVSDRQFPHLLAPITYAFAVLLWLTEIKVAFLDTFSWEVGLILASVGVGMDFCIAGHYKRYKTLLDAKQPRFIPS